MLHGSSLPRERAGTRFSRFERRAAVSRAVRNCHARCLPDPTSRFIGARETNGNTHEGFLRDGTPRRARKALALFATSLNERGDRGTLFVRTFRATNRRICVFNALTLARFFFTRIFVCILLYYFSTIHVSHELF